MAFCGDSQENTPVEPNLVQRKSKVTFSPYISVLDENIEIQQEIEALRQRIGAFYEQSTPTDLDEEGDQTYDPGPDPPLRTSFDPNTFNTPRPSPPPPPLPPPPLSPPLLRSEGVHHSNNFPSNRKSSTFSATSALVIPADHTNITNIKREKENRTDIASPTKPPTDHTIAPYRPPYRASGNTNSPFTAKVSNVKLTIRGNTQLGTRSSVPPSRLPPSIRHSHRPTTISTTTSTHSTHSTTHPSTHSTTHPSTHFTTNSRTSPPKSSVSPPKPSISPDFAKTIDETALDVLVCTPKQEKTEPGAGAHVSKKQKLELKQKPELKRAHLRAFTSPEVVAKLEVEQYMLEETLEELYQIVIDTKKQVVLDLASTSVSLTDFQSRVLQQLKAMETKCRTQQKQHQLALLHPKAEIIPKTESESNSLQDSLNLEKTKVLSLELVVEDLQTKMKDLDALLSERDAALSEMLRQLHENGLDPRADSRALPALSPPLAARPVFNRATSDIDPADDDDDDLLFEKNRDLSSPPPAPSPAPVLFPCHAPTDGESNQGQEVQAELHLKDSKQPDNLQNDEPHSTLEHDLAQEKAEKMQLQLALSNKDRELTELRQQVAQLHSNLNQHHEKSQQQLDAQIAASKARELELSMKFSEANQRNSQHLDQLRVTQQSNLLSLEVTAKDLKLQTDQLRHSLQEKDRQNAMLVQQNAQLEQEFRELESHAHNLHMLNQHLQAQEQSLNAQNQSLKTQHQRLQAQHGELRKICYDQDHTIADLTENLGVLQTQVQKLKVQLQQVEQHVQLHPLGASPKLQNPQQSSQNAQSTPSQKLQNPPSSQHQSQPQNPQTSQPPLPPQKSPEEDPLQPQPPQIEPPPQDPQLSQPQPSPPLSSQPSQHPLLSHPQLPQAQPPHQPSTPPEPLNSAQKLASAQQLAEFLQPSQSLQPLTPPEPLETSQKLANAQQHAGQLQPAQATQSQSHQPEPLTNAQQHAAQSQPAQVAQSQTRQQPSPPERLDVKGSAQILANAQQHADAVRKRYSFDTDDLEEIQKIIHELEKIFLETFTEISRLRGILQDEGISPTPLPTC